MESIPSHSIVLDSCERHTRDKKKKLNKILYTTINLHKLYKVIITYLTFIKVLNCNNLNTKLKYTILFVFL